MIRQSPMGARGRSGSGRPPYGGGRGGKPGSSRFGGRSEGSSSGPRGAGRGMGGGRDSDSRGGGRFFRKRVCQFCQERNFWLDLKESDKLLKFMTEKGKILPQRISGNCAKHQRMLSRAVKRARHASLIPFLIG